MEIDKVHFFIDSQKYDLTKIQFYRGAYTVDTVRGTVKTPINKCNSCICFRVTQILTHLCPPLRFRN